MALPNQPNLRVLITNITLGSRSGTETVTRDLAIGLHRCGHSPMVYSPQMGEIARELRAIGIPVFSSIDQICEKPDIIHGHHTIQTMVAATRFPQTPTIFVCHDFVAWHDAPPRLANIVGFAAVGDATHDRLTIVNGIPSLNVNLIENGVDMDRFKPGPNLPALPRNALIIAKSTDQIDPILDACSMRGIAATVVGPAIGKLLQAPETVMPEFDLIFASGLTAIEAMSCLRPVIVCDGRGLAGMVTLQNYPAWRRQNFGLRSLSRPLTGAAILREIDRYSASEATAVGLLVRSEAALPTWVSRYVRLYEHCIHEFKAREQDRDQENILAAMCMQNWPAPNNPEWDREHRLLRAEMLALQTGLQALPIGDRVQAPTSNNMALIGFHPTEDWGVWSAKAFCSVVIRISAVKNSLSVRVEYMVHLTPGKPRMEITCLVNGEPVITWSEAGESPQSRIRSFALPSSLSDSDELVFLSFKTSHLVSPNSENISIDPRPLGIGLIALTILSNDSVDSEVGAAPMLESESEVAVVVMAYKAPNSLVTAVQSILKQVPLPEIVVANSGGGDAKNLLMKAGINVRVIESAHRLLPGGTRNLGIVSTHSRYVAFLAADCTAETGWIAERLKAHHQGHAAVASALICHQPKNPIALAAHLSLFFRRMPRTPTDIALAYGGSYDRRLFSTYGLFREDMRGGEDTEFHMRLPAFEQPIWWPKVRTVHVGTSSLTRFIADQFRRGRRSAQAWHAINNLNRQNFAWGVLKRVPWAIQMSLQVVEPVNRLSAIFALPLICVGSLAYTLGAMNARTGRATSICDD